MAISEPLVDASVRHQVHIESMKAGDVSAVSEFLVLIDRKIRDLLASRAELTTYSRDKLERLLATIDKTLSGMYSGYQSDLLESLKAFSAYESGFEARAIEQVLSGVALSVPGPSTVWSAAKVTPMSVRGHSGGKLLKPFIKDWSKGEVDAVTGTIRRGVFEGQTNAQIVQGIRGTRALRYKDGLLDVTRRHAEAVVRTAVQHVASVARFQTWQSNEDIVVGYRWLSTLDSRTTQQCRSLDGRLFEVGKGPMPPIHISCRSTTVPELNDGLDFLDKGATGSSENGPVDADQSYYDWLKKQPYAFQKDVLGPTRAGLLRDGGLTSEQFARMNLSRNFRPLTLDEMRQREPLAFERAGL